MTLSKAPARIRNSLKNLQQAHCGQMAHGKTFPIHPVQQRQDMRASPNPQFLFRILRHNSIKANWLALGALER